MVGVPSDQWLRVRAEYLQNRKQDQHHEAEENEKEPEQEDIAQKAKDLFGEETVHMIDE